MAQLVLTLVTTLLIAVTSRAAARPGTASAGTGNDARPDSHRPRRRGGARLARHGSYRSPRSGAQLTMSSAGRLNVHNGGYRTLPLSLTLQCVTAIAVAGQSVSVVEPCSRSAAATSPNNEVANNRTVGMPDGLAGVSAHAEAFGGRPGFRRPAGVATPGCGPVVLPLCRSWSALAPTTLSGSLSSCVVPGERAGASVGLGSRSEA